MLLHRETEEKLGFCFALPPSQPFYRPFDESHRIMSFMNNVLSASILLMKISRVPFKIFPIILSYVICANFVSALILPMPTFFSIKLIKQFINWNVNILIYSILSITARFFFLLYLYGKRGFLKSISRSSHRKEKVFARTKTTFIQS